MSGVPVQQTVSIARSDMNYKDSYEKFEASKRLDRKGRQGENVCPSPILHPHGGGHIN